MYVTLQSNGLVHFGCIWMRISKPWFDIFHRLSIRIHMDTDWLFVFKQKISLTCFNQFFFFLCCCCCWYVVFFNHFGLLLKSKADLQLVCVRMNTPNLFLCWWCMSKHVVFDDIKFYIKHHHLQGTSNDFHQRKIFIQSFSFIQF